MATDTSSIDTVASLIKNSKRIIVLTGAGISTSAGVPDFRSPTTGLYDKLAPLKLPHPEAIFHINYFSHTPEPFYAIAQARNPRGLKPTVSHAFVALLANKNQLEILFTQNIDSLEQDAGVPADKVFPMHGNWKNQHCCKCKSAYPDDLMKRAIETGEVPYCLDTVCGGAVKPDVVFFGESLPAAFNEEIKRVSNADLMLIMGTSLQVNPGTRLPREVKEGVPRVLVNMEKAGDIGSRSEDVCILGSCDDIVRKLADAFGWTDELEKIRADAVAKKEKEQPYHGPSLDELIEKLAAKRREDSKISDGHRNMLEGHLAQKFSQLLPKVSPK